MMKIKKRYFGRQSPTDCGQKGTELQAKFVEMWEGKELGG
jgi:hypothetical protein